MDHNNRSQDNAPSADQQQQLLVQAANQVNKEITTKNNVPTTEFFKN